jgi:hypothetical protein
MAIDKKEIWVQWTRDAVSRYVVPDEVEDADELVDDMSDVALKFADTMLDEFEDRFEPAGDRRPRTRKRKSAAETD